MKRSGGKSADFLPFSGFKRALEYACTEKWEDVGMCPYRPRAFDCFRRTNNDMARKKSLTVRRVGGAAPGKVRQRGYRGAFRETAAGQGLPRFNTPPLPVR